MPKQTIYPPEHGVTAKVTPEQTCQWMRVGFHLGFAKACLSTHSKKQRHYRENKEVEM